MQQPIKYPFPFEPGKAVECVLYLAARLPRPGLHNIAKIFYFADKRHLREYGRLICGDSYVAMKYGPVPSAIYGMLKAVRDDARDQWTPRRDIVELARGALAVSGHRVKPLRAANLMELSDSDSECLDWAIKKYGGYLFPQLTHASHDRAWKNTPQNTAISLETMTTGYKGRGMLLNYLRNPAP
ncbi:MAG: Panacea domain-containing protein [Gammaproteobacteria bacterium]|nr:Panacea domain-containing protein [Gammaproteobacteria bacterium]MDD9850662.1 Panacea domain-containing protein [Gammaproteobacteria bacterium]